MSARHEGGPALDQLRDLLLDSEDIAGFLTDSTALLAHGRATGDTDGWTGPTIPVRSPSRPSEETGHPQKPRSWRELLDAVQADRGLRTALTEYTEAARDGPHAGAPDAAAEGRAARQGSAGRARGRSTCTGFPARAASPSW